MLKQQTVFALSALAFAMSPIAQADYANGPNPYDQHDLGGAFTVTGQGNFSNYGMTPPSDDPSGGFNLPSVGYSGTIANPITDPTPPTAGADLIWGGWNRGDTGTVWAEWDSFSSSTAEGMSGTSSAELTWSAGTFKAGSGNLYSFTSDSVYDIDIDVSSLTGVNQIALQVEQFAPLEAKWLYDSDGITKIGYGMNDDLWSISLDGGADIDRSAFEHTFYAADWQTSFGPTDLFTGIFLWNVDLTGVNNLHIDFENPQHTSLAQVAVDVGVVPLPAAVWLFGSGLLGLMAIARRKKV